MRRTDERLIGAWVPDPDQIDATYAPSLAIDADYVRYLTRQLDGLHQQLMPYRVERGNRIVLGARTPIVRYRFDRSGALHWNDRRYVRTGGADDRAWPSELQRVTHGDDSGAAAVRPGRNGTDGTLCVVAAKRQRVRANERDPTLGDRLPRVGVIVTSALVALLVGSSAVSLVNRAAVDCDNPPAVALVSVFPIVALALAIVPALGLALLRQRTRDVLIAAIGGTATMLAIAYWGLTGYARDLAENGIGPCLDGLPAYWPRWLT